MAHCCENETQIALLRGRQAWVLKVVLALNAGMFVIEVFTGILAGSTALLADSLDMLGDALVYGFSLYVIAKNERWRVTTALVKGLIMAAFGLGVLFEAVHKVFHPFVPMVEMMGIIGLLALAANTICFAMLWRHRGDDINMQSTWLCSRNDVIANIAVLLAAAGVWLLNSMWPDVVVGSIIAILFLQSALYVINESLKVLRR